MTAGPSLQPLLRPESIGIVGASATPGSFGHRTLSNIQAAGFAGRVVCVNPRYTDIDGVPCVPTIADAGDPLDTVLVVVPAERVPAVLADVAATGARSAIVMSSGFAETGDGGRVWEDSIRSISAAHAMPILGPNSLGILNFVHPCALTFGPGFGALVGGHAARTDADRTARLAVVSQSGALGSFLLHAANRGVRFSHYLAAGNSAVLDVGDLIAGLCRDASGEFGAICLTYEGLRPRSALLDALELAANSNVPVVALKTGTSAAGQAAARSHTGSAVGDSRAWRAALESRGVMCVDSLEQMLEPAEFLAKVGPSLSSRGTSGVAVVTGSGGAGVLACDLAARHGAPIAEFDTATVADLREVLPAFSRIANPLDITAAGAEHSDVLIDAVEMVASDPGVSVVVVPLGIAPGSTGPTAGRPAALAAAADRIDLPLAVVWLGQDQTHPAVELLTTSPRADYFSGVDLCLRTVAHLTRAPKQHDPTADHDFDIGAIAALLDSGPLDESIGYMVLDAIGIATARHMLAPNLTALTTALDDWDCYPAVVKVVSPDIAHKAAVGGVRAGLTGRDDVVTAAAEVVEAVDLNAPEAQVRGLLLQEMLEHCTEVLVGGIHDPQYGACVAIGVGGGNAGAGGKVSVRAAPMTAAAAVKLVRESPYLGHLTKSQAVAVADVALRVGELLAALPVIREIDINPVLVDRDGAAVAVDVLVVLDQAPLPAHKEELM